MSEEQPSLPTNELDPLVFLEEARQRVREQSGLTTLPLVRSPLTELLEEHIRPYLTRGAFRSVWLMVPIAGKKRGWVTLDSPEASRYIATCYARVMGEFLSHQRRVQLLEIIEGIAITMEKRHNFLNHKRAKAFSNSRNAHKRMSG